VGAKMCSVFNSIFRTYLYKVWTALSGPFETKKRDFVRIVLSGILHFNYDSLGDL
jgi:hypothetical protein